MTTIIVHLHSPCFPRKPSGDIPCRLLFGKSISWSGANASKHFSNPTSLHSHKLPSYFGYGIRESCTQRARCWQSTTVCMMAGSNSILPALVRKGLKLTLQMQTQRLDEAEVALRSRGRDLVQGRVQDLSVVASRVQFQGVALSGAELSARSIQLDLSQLATGRLLKEPFQVAARLQMSNQDLTTRSNANVQCLKSKHKSWAYCAIRRAVAKGGAWSTCGGKWVRAPDTSQLHLEQ
mmetsp:Transcript_3459/g.6470  ORF Transcript_3459/g.6470 Transcript_3459/m.6470 type:complete len:236 (-) Transcript_3459:270-977(-)